MQLTEKYEENFDVSSEGPSSGVTRPPEYKLPVYKPTIYNAQAITGHMSSSVYKPLRLSLSIGRVSSVEGKKSRARVKSRGRG